MTIRPTITFQPAAAIVFACLALTMNAHSVSDKVLFDFTTATNSPAWQIVNDDVMGGVSASSFSVTNSSQDVFGGVPHRGQAGRPVPAGSCVHSRLAPSGFKAVSPG
jgi:hypothetical protein